MIAWLQRQTQRETFYPAIALIVSIVWLFMGDMSTGRFDAWVMGAGAFLAILTGGTVLAKHVANKAAANDATANDPAMTQSQDPPA